MDNCSKDLAASGEGIHPAELERMGQEAKRGGLPLSPLVSRCKFGEEISDNRFVDGRLKKGHVALGLAAGRNENEFSVSDALPCTIDDPKLRRVQFVVGKVDGENCGLDFFEIRSWVVVGTCFEAMHKVGVDLAAPTQLGDVFEQRLCRSMLERSF